MPEKTTIEEAKAFIQDCEKSRANWLTMADRSWNEIKKRMRNHRLWSVTPNSLRKRSKYPAWGSIFKIRQPLLLSRVGIPIGRDTTQDGNDNVGATAAMCKERLAVNLAKSFDFFDSMCDARDDFLATNVGQVRGYYMRDEIKERVKEYITPQKEPNGEVVFVDGAGKVIESDDIGQDDEGYFIEHDEVVDVENEVLCLEPVLYKDFYVDPDIRRWRRCKRLAFACYYSEPEFKQIYGATAFANLTLPDDTEGKSAAHPKRQTIKVYEYWDDYTKEVLWWAEHGSEFIRPRGYYIPDNEEQLLEGEGVNGLYNLDGFFPCPTPILTNQPTDEFWPVPEYYQLLDVLEDIHTIFSRMVAITKAIRSRLLFDNNIEGLQSALNEAAENDSFGIPNLGQALAGVGGSLDNVVQYIPVEKPIAGLNELYKALEQRLNIVYKLTGTSDLLQGLITDPTQRTFGERQMTEKYALNQLAEPQRKMQEFVRACYELMCEMALKNFKDASLDMYIMPQTLPPEHQARYRAALGMLKENHKRFRIELETDSTIALNEEYDKQVRVELVTTLTNALEKTATIAQQSPALVLPELHAMKYLIQGLRQAKMFQGEIVQAIDNVIQQAQAQEGQPAFNKDETMARLKQMELQSTLQLKQAELSSSLQLEEQKLASNNQLVVAEMQSRERIETAKLEVNDRIATIQAQLENFKVQSQNAVASQNLQAEFAKINSDIAATQADIALKRDELLLEIRKATSAQQVKEFQVMLDQQVAASDAALARQAQSLEAFHATLIAREKAMQEARLEAEQRLNMLETQMQTMKTLKELQAPPQPPMHLTIHAPKPSPVRKRIKITRDEFGNLQGMEAEEEHAEGSPAEEAMETPAQEAMEQARLRGNIIP